MGGLALEVVGGESRVLAGSFCFDGAIGVLFSQPCLVVMLGVSLESLSVSTAGAAGLLWWVSWGAAAEGAA